jgi:NitT/TauT family transport system substrate-binding protein
VATLAALAAPAPAAAQLEPVTLRADVFFYGAHVPFLSGIVNGIYEKHGLKVTAQPGRGSATVLQTVANRSDDFGFADGGTHVKLAAQGLKAKQIVGILQRSPMVVMAKPDSGISKPSDLNGRTGGFTPGSSPEQIFPAFAKIHGIDMNGIKQVSADIPTRDSIFILGQTEFSFGYTVTQVPILQERCKCELVVMRYADNGITAISNGIVASDALIAEKPDVVRRFVAATVEAIEAAVKDPESAVDAFFEYAKKVRFSRDVVAQQWQETIKILHTDATKDKPYGYTAASDWQKTIDLLVNYADVPKGAVTPAMVHTNEFLPK